VDYVCGVAKYYLYLLLLSFSALFATHGVYSLETVRILFPVANYSTYMEHHEVINLILHSTFPKCYCCVYMEFGIERGKLGRTCLCT
jgi:hypothetical protein